MWDRQHLFQGRTMFVPMPPSRARGDADYDPRIVQVLNSMSRPGRQLDIRDCLSFDGRHVASHDTDERPGPDELYAALHFDPVAGRPAEPPETIVLFDDMLTTGAHFVAASRKMAEFFPGVPVVGYFIARRVLPNATDAFDDFDII
jgi:predicted amidophosphoribosyltransferase